MLWIGLKQVMKEKLEEIFEGMLKQEMPWKF